MKKIIPIIILLIISAFLIFYRFNNIPKNLTFDEVEFAKLALSLQNKPYISYSTLATGHSTLYFYILLTSLKIFGTNSFALRLPSAVFGILSVIVFYLILKIIFQKYDNLIKKQYLSFILSFIFLSSHWFINFARFSFEVTFLLFLELISIYYLLKINQKPKNNLLNIYLMISGLFAGLSFLSYTPGRIFFVLPLILIISQSIDRPTLKKSNYLIAKQLIIFFIPFLITITPLTTYLSTHIDTRIDQQFFLMNHEMTINQKLVGLWSNISSIGLMFNFKGDINGRHNYPGKPALNPIFGILFLIGLIISIKDWKKYNNRLFLLYFILSLLPALSTYPWENPNMLRTFTVIPSVVYFSGQGLLIFINYFNRIGKKNIILFVLMIIISVSSYYELRTYFKYQSLVFRESFEIYNPLEKELKLNKDL